MSTDSFSENELERRTTRNNWTGWETSIVIQGEYMEAIGDGEKCIDSKYS